MKPIRKVSRKQQKKNQEINKIKKDLGITCERCSRYGANDLAHILPKSTFPQYYTEKWNLMILCRECHDQYDSSKQIRSKQEGIYMRAIVNVRKEDKGRVMNYFNKII